MILCPNLKNPEVARVFDELKQATSEQAAYHIWSLNNGNAIDKAPNGAESKLLQTLLQHYNGDRTKAIQAKAKTYGNSFLTWFGDWINDVENASKVVDENGEPLMVWHGGYLTENNSMPNPTYEEETYDWNGYLIPGREINPGIWFSTDKEYTTNFSSKQHPCFLNIRNPYRADDLSSRVAADVRELEDYTISEEDLQAQGGKSDGLIGHDVKTWGGLTIEELKISSRFVGQIPKLSKGIEFAIYDPNQAKSIDNEGPTPWEGTYSRENDDIYHLSSDYIDTPDISNSDLLGFKINQKYLIEKFISTFDLPNNFYWFDKLVAVAQQLNIKIKFENPQRAGLAGEFQGDTITLYIDQNNPAFVHTVIHEMLHATLHSILDANSEELTPLQKKARQTLDDLYNKFVQTKNKPGKYSNITDIHEFVSELSNQDFRNYIKYHKGLRGLFEKLIEAIKQLCDIGNKRNDQCDFAIEQLLDKDVLYKDTNDISLNLSNKQYSNIMATINRQWYTSKNGYNVSYFDDITVLWEKTQNGAYLIQVAEQYTDESAKLISFAKRYYLNIGEKGASSLDAAEEATTRMDNLSMANEMEKAGKDALTIKQATGWERGADGKWRYEIPDFRLSGKLHAIINDNSWYMLYPKDLKLKDVVYYKDLEQLKNLYPSLLEFDVELTKNPNGGNVASIDIKNKKMTLCLSYDDNIIRGAFVHELQHYVQRIEGFANGGSPLLMNRERNKRLSKEAEMNINDAKVKNNPIVTEIAKLFTEYKEDGRSKLGFVDNMQTYNDHTTNPKDFPFDDLRLYPQTEKQKTLAEDIRKLQANLIKEHKVKYYYDESITDEDYYSYRNLAGEVEARTAANRRTLSLEERKNSLFTDDMYKDVAKEDLIFLQDGLENGITSMVDFADGVNFNNAQSNQFKLQLQKLGEELMERCKG